MKILVLSDSHGNIVRLKHVVGYANAQKLGAIIHCGDWDNTEAVLTMKDAEIPVYPEGTNSVYPEGTSFAYGVLGNADVDPSILTSLRNANVIYDIVFLKLVLDGKNIGVCHFPGKLEEAIKSQEYDVLFHGHTHKKKDKLFGKTRVVNPGALQKTPTPSFAVYDTDNSVVEFVDVQI